MTLAPPATSGQDRPAPGRERLLRAVDWCRPMPGRDRRSGRARGARRGPACAGTGAFAMTVRAVDQEALRTSQRSGLPPCLYIAVGARDELAIQRYVGRIVEVLAGGSPPRALLIECVFRSKATTHSVRRRPLIPFEGDHPFQAEGDQFSPRAGRVVGMAGRVVAIERNRPRGERRRLGRVSLPLASWSLHRRWGVRCQHGE
jgi:hypothetical protein